MNYFNLVAALSISHRPCPRTRPLHCSRGPRTGVRGNGKRTQWFFYNGFLVSLWGLTGWGGSRCIMVGPEYMLCPGVQSGSTSHRSQSRRCPPEGCVKMSGRGHGPDRNRRIHSWKGVLCYIVRWHWLASATIEGVLPKFWRWSPKEWYIHFPLRHYGCGGWMSRSRFPAGVVHSWKSWLMSLTEVIFSGYNVHCRYWPSLGTLLAGIWIMTNTKKKYDLLGT